MNDSPCGESIFVTWSPKIYHEDARWRVYFLYGSGVAINKKKAIKEALVDLSSKLGIHVQSKFQTSTKVTGNGYYETIEKNSEGNIKTEVKDLYISQYKIEEVYTASPIELKFPNNYLW
ncbi:hypothetical protein BMR06_01035 [Methylococcaceae bacterium HT5]|nr:hypothetical protein BMR06_01035 [Methylococcaceae bacterium HT5]